MIKRIYAVMFKTLGTMISTAKDSFMEGYNTPYSPAEEKVTAFTEDSDLAMADTNKTTFIRDVS